VGDRHLKFHETRDNLQAAVNSRPRKVLAWKTPAEVLDEQLQSLHQAGVATTR
jgi:transposase, IS30 family